MSASSAETDWEQWCGKDPLPDIEPSLLHSHHIHQYAQDYGCLVSNYQEDNLKPASYEIKLYGELHYWVEDYRKRTRTRVTEALNDKGQLVKLPKTSIAFVYLRDEFRLPDYIAARFNLHIRHVHQGLLLGTGPLVDPGFNNRLLVPLHNLTSNDYTLQVGDGFIWVEFTKVSRHSRWGHKVPTVSPDHFKKFDDRKNKRAADDYFKNSRVLDNGIVSSIGSVLDESRQATLNAERSVETLRNWGIAVAIGLLIAVASMTISVLSLVNSVNQNVESTIGNCCYDTENSSRTDSPSTHAPPVQAETKGPVSEESPDVSVDRVEEDPDVDMPPPDDVEDLTE